MLALSPAGPPPTMATSYAWFPSSVMSTSPVVRGGRRARRVPKGSPRRAGATRSVPQRTAGHQVQQSQRGAVRHADLRRGRFAVHHARGIIGVIEAEGVADLVSEDPADHARGKRPSAAVLGRDRDVRARDEESARLGPFGDADALAVLRRKAFAPADRHVRADGVVHEGEREWEAG